MRICVGVPGVALGGVGVEARVQIEARPSAPAPFTSLIGVFTL